MVPIFLVPLPAKNHTDASAGTGINDSVGADVSASGDATSGIGASGTIALWNIPLSSGCWGIRGMLEMSLG